MGRYCIFCGQLMTDDMICANPDCERNNREKPIADPTRKRPMRLVDRQKQIRSRIIKEPGEAVEIPEEGEDLGDGYEEQNCNQVDWDSMMDMEDEPAEEVYRTVDRSWNMSKNALIRLPAFLREHYKTSACGRQGGEAERGVGIIMVLASICLSSLGTFLFGSLYLEDFFWRWIVVGIVAPLMAYACSFLYGRLFIALCGTGESVGTNVPVKGLFSAVTSSATFPNLLLLLSSVLSPMDRTLRIFQFFALLLVIAWIISLLFSLVSKYGLRFNIGAMILTIAFAFLALTTMRTIWVWYLVGEFDFALYLPLSVFFSGY